MRQYSKAMQVALTHDRSDDPESRRAVAVALSGIALGARGSVLAALEVRGCLDAVGQARLGFPRCESVVGLIASASHETGQRRPPECDL
jgi:hypothetical protein